MMMHNLLMPLLMLLTFGCAAAAEAQPGESGAPRSDAPTTAPAAKPETTAADPELDAILDALHKRGEDLQSLAADVKLTDIDETTGSDVSRTGTFLLQRQPDGSARARITFDKRQANNRITEDKIEYLLDGRNLIDRTYRTKTQVTRQILEPGEKLNLLKLGEGPFPLPIGQEKEEVKKMFHVEQIAPEPGEADEKNTVHLRLTPRPGTQFERRFQSIDAWVDLTDHMPKRIETVDPNGITVRETVLSNVRINPKLSDDDFALAKIDEQEWNLIYEEYQD